MPIFFRMFWPDRFYQQDQEYIPKSWWYFALIPILNYSFVSSAGILNQKSTVSNIWFDTPCFVHSFHRETNLHPGAVLGIVCTLHIQTFCPGSCDVVLISSLTFIHVCCIRIHSTIVFSFFRQLCQNAFQICYRSFVTFGETHLNHFSRRSSDICYKL